MSIADVLSQVLLLIEDDTEEIRRKWGKMDALVSAQRKLVPLLSSNGTTDEKKTRV